LEDLVEGLRRSFLGHKGWSVEDHYSIEGGFFLDRARADAPEGVTLAMAVGNWVIPNLLFVKVNGTSIELMTEPERAPYSSWSHTRSREYRLEVTLPPVLLVPGENRVRIQAGMLPGLVELGGVDDLSGVHNMSVDQVTLVVPPAPGP